MITSRRNPSQRWMTSASLIERAAIALGAGKFSHAAQRSSLRHSGRRPPHPRRRDCLGSDARSRRTGGTLDFLRVTSVHSVPCTNRCAFQHSIGSVNFSALTHRCCGSCGRGLPVSPCRTNGDRQRSPAVTGRRKWHSAVWVMHRSTGRTWSPGPWGASGETDTCSKKPFIPTTS